MSNEADRWAARYEQLRPRLIRALAAATGRYDGVEDAVQEAFLALLNGKLDDEANPEGWLYVVALNHLRRTHWRARWLRHRTPEVPLRDELNAAITRLDAVARLQRLSERDRVLLIGRYYLGLSQNQLAELLQVSRGTISSGVSRAGKRFRELEGRA